MKAVPILLIALACLAACVQPAPQPQPSGDAELTSFSLLAPAVEGEIDLEAGTVSIQVPVGTDVTALVAVFSATGSEVTVGGAPQVSGQTVNDFSAPLEYRACAADGSFAAYMVSVTRAAPLSAEKAIVAFSFLHPEAAGVIDQEAYAVHLTVPHGTDITSLVAVFTTMGVAVTVDDTEQESGVTVNDFTDPLTYIVAAEDGTTCAYTVSVGVAPNTEKSMTSFGLALPAVQGVIDQDARVIRVPAPEGTDLSSLIAVFSTTGARVSVQGREQASGVTVNDFGSPLDYIVTAEDGSETSYSVRVSAHIPLLINELDVDQVGTDSAEYIELYAAGDADLCGVAVVLINGGVTPGLEYARIDLSPLGALPSGTYLVIAGPNVPVPPPTGKYTPQGWELSNRIQNGPNDAVMLFDTLGQRVIDTVTYAGILHRALIIGHPTELDATEGSAGAPADSNSAAGSIGRSPNAADTGHNNMDFKFNPALTPGAPN
jgi:hypothetical protein